MAIAGRIPLLFAMGFQLNLVVEGAGFLCTFSKVGFARELTVSSWVP